MLPSVSPLQYNTVSAPLSRENVPSFFDDSDYWVFTPFPLSPLMGSKNVNECPPPPDEEGRPRISGDPPPLRLIVDFFLLLALVF